MPARDPSENMVIAVQNGGGIRQNAGNLLPAGGTPGEAITRLDTLNVLPFDNYLVSAENVTGESLFAILEHSCSSVGGGGFLQVSSLSYTCDVSQAEGSRVIDATFTNGTPDDRRRHPDRGRPDPGRPGSASGSSPTSSPRVVATGTQSFAEQLTQRLRNAEGTQIFYEQAWREYLESLPASGDPELPTIAAADARYAEQSGEGRITVLGLEPAEPSPAAESQAPEASVAPSPAASEEASPVASPEPEESPAPEESAAPEASPSVAP